MEASTNTHEQKTPDVIYILSGQSNMAGRGELLPEQDSEENERVLLLHGSGENAHWQRAREPLHREAELSAHKNSGFGSGMVFAERLLNLFDDKQAIDLVLGDKKGMTIGLVPTAVGGTGMDVWHPGGELFSNMLKQTASSRSVGKGSASPVLGGLLFYQGETDALEERTAQEYNRNLQDFIRTVRAELGDELPIVLVAISGAIHRVPFCETVRQAQKRAAQVFPLVACVDSMGLQMQADGLHLDRSAQLKLGVMLADAMFGMSKL